MLTSNHHTYLSHLLQTCRTTNSLQVSKMHTHILRNQQSRLGEKHQKKDIFISKIKANSVPLIPPSIYCILQYIERQRKRDKERKSVGNSNCKHTDIILNKSVLLTSAVQINEEILFKTSANFVGFFLLNTGSVLPIIQFPLKIFHSIILLCNL